MRIFLVAWLICQIEAAGSDFREHRSNYGQIYVEAASYPASRRILRSSNPSYSRPLRSRVFRNVQHLASFSSDEPRLYKSSGRFSKRAQAVPTHELVNQNQKPAKDSVQIISYSYDEDKHHVNKLSEDNQTMVEANEYARSMERTTVAVKTEDIIVQKTTPIPTVTTTPYKLTIPNMQPSEERHEFKQPPPAFIQTPIVSRSSPSATRTFSQTVIGQLPPSPIPSPVLANRGIPNLGGIGGTTNTAALIPPPPPLAPQPPPLPGAIPQPGQPLFLPVPQQPLGPQPVKDLPGQPIGSQLPPQIPPLPGIPNMNGPPQLLQPPPVPGNMPNTLVPNNISNGIASPINPPIAPPPPPQPSQPQPDNRFEIINGQAANSSLEQLGCSFDWLTNTCKDVFALGWCGRCHDFGNIFLHDCKCIQPLVPVPPRQPQPTPQSPRPALFWLFN